MTIPTNSPYSNSSFIKNRQQEALIAKLMKEPSAVIDLNSCQNLPKRSAITILALRALHNIRMFFSLSANSYKNRFIQATVKIEEAQCNAKKSAEKTADQSLKMEPQPVLPKPQPAPVKNVSESLKISTGIISAGQGEYLIFHQLENGDTLPPSAETFEKAYELLLQHNPRVLVQQGIDACENRHQLLCDALKEVDPTLTAVFVPKTLYELVFIRKCINEDLKAKKVCRHVLERNHEGSLNDSESTHTKPIANHKCWHICLFRDEGDDRNENLQKMAMRMNKVLLKNLKPTSKGFTFQEIRTLGEREIDYLKNYYMEVKKKITENKISEIVHHLNTGGPTNNFFRDESYGDNTYGWALRNEEIIGIIRNAIFLDCSDDSKQSLFLYRSSNLHDDNATRVLAGELVPYSLSYGTSLFAGCLYDATATAYTFMVSEKTLRHCNSHVISIPFDQVDSSPFFVPKTNTLSQLYGFGEIFHARTKGAKNVPLEMISGIQGTGVNYSRDHLKSDLTLEQLEAEFAKYKAKALNLK